MTINSCLARNVMAASVLMICAACGSAPSVEQTPAADTGSAGNFFMGTNPVYAHLVNNKDGSWVFRTITASDEPPESAYLVRLNDLSPAFDTRVAECMPQMYPESHRCNPTSPFRDEESGVLEKIINGSIAVGTGGKITDITYDYETHFDETAFNRAVDEAMAISGFDRRQLISLLASYDEELRLARAELQAVDEQLQAMYASADNVVVTVEPSIDGLTEYYQGDIDFAQLVDLEPANSVAPQVVNLEAAPILPCDARNCVAAADSALAALRATVRSNKEQVAAGMRPSSRLFKVRCDMVSYAGYLLRAECPTEVIANGDEPVQVPVNVTILSRDFVDLFPDFEMDGTELRVSIDGQTVTFSNTTDEYLTVSAQTVYYNSTVHTTAQPIDIPPGISVTRDLREFVSQPIDIESRYLQMTPDKARGASFEFGFAVRYQLASDPESRTLHDMDTFNVDCVIRERITPGSCQPESLADASVPPETTKPDPRPGAPM
jgi:hypothetical protein